MNISLKKLAFQHGMLGFDNGGSNTTGQSQGPFIWKYVFKLWLKRKFSDKRQNNFVYSNFSWGGILVCLVEYF